MQTRHAVQSAVGTLRVARGLAILSSRIGWSSDRAAAATSSNKKRCRGIAGEPHCEREGLTGTSKRERRKEKEEEGRKTNEKEEKLV